MQLRPDIPDRAARFNPARSAARFAEVYVPPGRAGHDGSTDSANANVSTTATYYIKSAADDVRSAMTMLENRIAEAGQSNEKNSEIPKPERTTLSTAIQ
jgi:hypothetical protein